MTNIYNTGNPLGSTDPRDLLDNASNLDDAMNSASPTFPDRFLVQRDTWAGQQNKFNLAQSGREAEFQQFLADSGFVSLGNYAAGLNFTAYNQYMARDGFFYRPAPSSIPFTTTGTWVGGDEDLFNLFSADDVLRQDLGDSGDASKGAAILGNGVVSVQSIASLLLQQQRSDLRYLVSGYYAGETIGGGEFYWDAASTEAENLGTVFAVVGVPTGRFKRLLTDTYIRTSQFGIDRTGATSAVDRLQSMIELELPIWLDSGTYLINKTLFYKNTTIHGPGTLAIVVDSGFTKVADSFMTDDAVITARAPIAAGPTYRVDIQCGMTFSNSDQSMPKYPIRFVGLRDSIVKLNFVGTGSGNVLETNAPDFYFDNRNVEISGTYILNHRLPTNIGGLWVRDVGLAGADSTTKYSENVVVKSETYVRNDGVDEALAFFNPSGGTMRNCGVEAATLVGRGLVLGFLEFNAAGRSITNFDCYATNTKCEVTGLRLNQPAVKADKSAPHMYGVTVKISGYESPATAGGFYAGFRNSTNRSNPEYPVLTACRVVMAGGLAAPASEVRCFDGNLRVIECLTIAEPGAALPSYGVKNGNYVNGGRWSGATVATFDTVTEVLDPRPTNVTYSNVTRRRGVGIYRTEALVADGSGNVTFTHNFGVNPSFAMATLENAFANDIVITARGSTTVTARVFVRSTGAAVPGANVTVNWQVEA